MGWLEVEVASMEVVLYVGWHMVLCGHKIICILREWKNLQYIYTIERLLLILYDLCYWSKSLKPSEECLDIFPPLHLSEDREHEIHICCNNARFAGSDTK